MMATSIILWPLILLLWPQTQVVAGEDKEVDPVLNICDDGLPDVVVTLAGGDGYLFKGYTFWAIKDDLKSVGPLHNISEQWPNLPRNLDIGFSVTGDNAQWNQMIDKTIFVKRRNWFTYTKEKKFDARGNLTIWSVTADNEERANKRRLIWGSIRTQSKDSVVYMTLHLRNIRFMASEKHHIFDDPIRPEGGMKLEMITEGLQFPVTARGKNFLVPFSGGRFMYFWAIKGDGYYCSLGSITGTCTKKRVASLFDCDQRLFKLRDNNWLANIFYAFSLDIHSFMTLVVGFQTGVSMVLLVILVVLSSRAYALFYNSLF